MAGTWWTDPSELDEEQRKVVALPTDGHHLVLGPPGSGKTNLLLLRAVYLHKAGTKHIAVLTFGRVLREFLAAGTEHYTFAGDKIQTYARWGKSLLRENGITVNETETDFEKVREELLSGLRDVANRHESQNMFDCILIDEAQDYSPDEIKVIAKLTHKLFAVGDSNQKIINENGDALEQLESDGIAVSCLHAHYRNGLAICRVADGILDLVDSEDGLEATSNYDEESFPSTVRSMSGLSISAQLDAALKEIKTQLVAYPDELIGILCPRKEELKKLGELLRSSELEDQVHIQHGEYSAMNQGRRVILTTIHGAKGLEFRAAHLLGMDFVKKFRAQKRMCYTAVTRSKTSLAIYHNGALPGYLERGLQACSTRPKTPSLDELFE